MKALSPSGSRQGRPGGVEYGRGPLGRLWHPILETLGIRDGKGSAGTQTRAQTFVAPARVNLIGEHTDYTGGLVLPMAIPFFTMATIEPANDGLYTFASDRFPTVRTLTPENREPAKHDWSDYPVGVLRELQALGYQPDPFSMRLRGDVPLGSGLSSSASVEVAAAFALLGFLSAQMAPEEIALLCQRAENVYVNSPCGIMDQTVVTVAEEGHAVLLDTRTLRQESVPMNRGALADAAVVVCNSTVKHSIGGGEYGQRRREVEEGQTAVLAAHPQLRTLGDATLADLERVRAKMSVEAFRRCRHIVTENARVRAMREALLAGDADGAGELMLAAHASERDDFACSVAEVDFLVETAAKLPGCYGARLTGGGFGGCTVNLVRKDEVEHFNAELQAAYAGKFGLQAPIFVCEPVDGALRRSERHSPAPRLEQV